MYPYQGESVFIWGKFNNKYMTIPTKVRYLYDKSPHNVASGGNFYLLLTTTGDVYTWGNSRYARFGVIANYSIVIPQKIKFKVPIVVVAAGNWHSMVIDMAGVVYAVGHNKSGACGVGSFDDIDQFCPVKLTVSAYKLALGDCFSIIVDTEDNVYTCGHGQYHGHKTNYHIPNPQKLPFGEKIIAIGAGFTHSLAASSEKKTYSWGKGECHQLGHGSTEDQKQPKEVKALAGIAIVQVSCSRGEKYSSSMAVSSDGNAYSWGAGYKGKLGHQAKWTHENPANEPTPRKIENVEGRILKCSAGGIHSNMLTEDGRVLSFGCGSDGRLGHAESSEFRYLYREGYPRPIDALKDYFIKNLYSSYYHNICIGHRR